jgi:preprotein translocase subunit SecA
VTEFATRLPVQHWLDEDTKLYEEALRERIKAELDAAYQAKCDAVGDKMRLLEKQLVLQILDNLWKEHLSSMDQLRQGIFLRGYAGKNPKQEYKREAFGLFQNLLSNLQHEVTRFLSHVQVRTNEEIDAIERQRAEERAREKLLMQHAEASAMQERAATDQGSGQESRTPFIRDEKVGRNDPCPCGSGKKFKQCHGQLS